MRSILSSMITPKFTNQLLLFQRKTNIKQSSLRWISLGIIMTVTMFVRTLDQAMISFSHRLIGLIYDITIKLNQ